MTSEPINEELLKPFELSNEIVAEIDTFEPIKEKKKKKKVKHVEEYDESVIEPELIESTKEKKKKHVEDYDESVIESTKEKKKKKKTPVEEYVDLPNEEEPILTKSQLKRLRKKQMTPEEKAATLEMQKKKEEVVIVTNKKVPAAIRAIKEAQAKQREMEEKLKLELEERLKKEEEERLIAIESERLRIETETRRAEEKRKKKEAYKKAGGLTGSALAKQKRDQEALKVMLAANKMSVGMQSKLPELIEKDSHVEDIFNMRSPICCILGHVDTGKTKILDRIRHTNVQNMEAGGITQQIGATFIPINALRTQTATLTKDMEFKLPGLLIIDTPGHESFSNMRSRGSGLCDIAVLVVDIMHGLEPQTIESINLLKMRKTPFIVALNKVDRCYDWNPNKDSPFQESLSSQSSYTQKEFEERTKAAMLQLNEQGLNCELYYKNKDFRKNISIVPTSAITGEGIPDLLFHITQLTQHMMSEKLTYRPELQCTVLEVKITEGFGYTLDVILVNGVLRVGDTIVLCGLNGPIVTKIRTLLTPQPMKELRVKSEYTHLQEVKASMGIKVVASDLEHVIAGSSLLVCSNPIMLKAMKEEVMSDLSLILSKISKTDNGVYVQASTLGSLEALLSFLEKSKIPVSGVGLGTVYKKDIMKAATMLERKREYATILAFDVKIAPDAQILADSSGVKIFTAEIIYHLVDMFSKYLEEIKTQIRNDTASEVVFPVVIEILSDCIFNKKPLIVGVIVKDGILKIGTMLCVPSKDNLILGRCVSIQENHVDKQMARKGDKVCIRIELDNKMDSCPVYGRHYDHTNQIVSKLTRKSIDLLKEFHKDELTQKDWQLVIELKKVFGI